MSNKDDGKTVPKKVEWHSNPDVTMIIQKSDDGWTPNKNVTHRFKESKESK